MPDDLNMTAHDGSDHETYADWWTEREERAGIRGEFPADGDAAAISDGADIQIISKRSLADARKNQPVEVIRGKLAVRGNTTVDSSTGGLGKTLATTQMLIEGSQELTIFGVDEFSPVGRLRSLLVNSEDQLANLDYVVSHQLPAYGLDHVPFDLFVVAETASGEFILTPANARALAERINAERYDLVAFDPAIGFLPSGIKFIDPGAIRQFLKRSLGIIQRETQAAIWLNHHDNKAGDALSGPADWGNFCRLALHLEPGARDDTRTLSRVKSNFGYPFKKITLQLDAATLCFKAVELERYGDKSRNLASPEGIAEALAKIVRAEIIQLPSEQRTKWAVIEALYRKSVAAKLKITKEAVKGFAATHLRYEDRQLGQTKAKIVVGVVEEQPQ